MPPICGSNKYNKNESHEKRHSDVQHSDASDQTAHPSSLMWMGRLSANKGPMGPFLQKTSSLALRQDCADA